MDLVSSIAEFSIARSMAEARVAAATKVLNIARSTDQAAADMLTSAIDDVADMVEDFAGEIGAHIDTLA